MSSRRTIQDPRSEKQIQRDVSKALKTIGWAVYDLSQPRATKQTPGLADLWVAGFGVVAWLEVKTQRGRQTDAQKAFERAVRDNGGHYRVVRSATEAVEYTESLREKARERARVD